MWVKRNTFLQGIKVVAFLVVLVILWDIVNAIFVNGPDSHKYLFKMVDYLKKALIYGHTSRISS